MNNYLQSVRKMMPAWFLENKLAVARELIELHSVHASDAKPPEELRTLEIGAGWDLLLPMAMRGCGCGELHCIDIHPHLDDGRIGAAVEMLGRIDGDGCGVRVPRWPHPNAESMVRVLKECYAIHYAAPCDARATSFETGSFDLFLSYNVMEHIPVRDLPAIHRESFRVLKKGAVAIHHVDLQDHWAYATPRRSVHGFLANGPWSWKFLNPPIHFQNRLRAKDHLQALVDAGFEIAWKRETAATPEQLEALRRPGAVLPEYLERMSLDELGVTNLVVVARKPT